MNSEDAQPQTLGWRPGLDGLRAIAVLAVVLFHYQTRQYLPGGAFGVDLFLALSGFLITTLLLQEWRSTGRIDLPAFYLRRFLRLFPALALFCVIYLITVPLTDRLLVDMGSWKSWLGSLAYGITYTMNWALALDLLRAPAGVAHLWSLALEEQFYMLWPACLILLLRFRPSLHLLMAATLLLTMASLSVPYLLISDGWTLADRNRVYFGADFRAHGLLLGSLAAQLYVGGWLRPEQVTRRPFAMVAATACAVLILFMFTSGTHNPALYLAGGFALISLCCSIIVVYAAFAETGPVANLLRLPLLTYLGRRSYAIYLYHLGIGSALREQPLELQLALGLALSVLAAEVSYRLVEAPALRLKQRFVVQADAPEEPKSEQPRLIVSSYQRPTSG